MTNTTTQRSWWDRNWKWFVPTGCLGVILIFAAAVAAFFFAVAGAMKSSDAYREAVQRATTHPAVLQKLGAPIRPGFFVMGNVHVSGSRGEADMSVSLSGPNGDATLHFEATKAAGLWTFSVLVVSVEGPEAERIDLLAGGR